MTINKTVNGCEAVIALEGRLDAVTAPELEAVIGKLPYEVTSLTLDMEKLEYVSSAGLRVLLGAHKTMSDRGGMRLINVGELVAEVLDITGFSEILTIE